MKSGGVGEQYRIGYQDRIIRISKSPGTKFSYCAYGMIIKSFWGEI